jgi:hypothetical protein
MVQLTEETKVYRMNKAFGKLVAELMEEGHGKSASTAMKAFNELNPISKARLFDIITTQDQ